MAPVNIARSSVASFLVGPKPGRSTTLIFILPLTLFIIKAALTDWATEATISKDRLFFITYSKIDCIFLTLGISDEQTSINGLSNSHTCFSVLVTKFGDVNPQSTWTPSTIST